MTLFRSCVLILTFLLSAAVSEAACTFTETAKTLVLTASCSTTTAILIPDGKTLDGNGFTVTGVDPTGDHFRGAVVRNGGATAHVTNITVTVSGLADACDGGADRLRGIMFQGASGSITNSSVINIKQGASGCQEGNAIEVRNFSDNPATSRVTIDGNTVSGYQKTGILANGNVDVTVTDNHVDGGGPVNYIARNGIQIGFGGTGMVKRNQVDGNSYAGASAVSGGILVVGGPGYSLTFPTFCVGVQIMQNNLSGNDVGVYLSQYEADFSAPATATNIKVIGNVIIHSSVTNGYVYQAGVSDVGNNDKIINNQISGAGYDPLTLPTSTFAVDADPSYAHRAKVHANK